MNSVADMLSILNDHGFEEIDTGTKVAYLQEAIDSFCSREPWPFLEAKAFLNFSGSNSVSSNQPADFRAALTVANQLTGQVLIPERLDNIVKQLPLEFRTQVVDDPAYYYFSAGQLAVAPVPSATFVAFLHYLRIHPTITSDSVSTDFLIPSRHWMVLVYDALVRLYDRDDDPDMGARMEQHRETKIAQIRNEIWQNQYDRSDAVVVLDDSHY